MIRKLKKISWISLIGIFFLLGYFHQHALTGFYQYAIQAYIFANFGCQLSFKEAYMENNRLIFEHPGLPNDNNFEAEKMALTWSFNLRNKEIYITVELEKPSWRLDSYQNLNEEKIKKVFKGKKGGLKYFFDLTVNNGKASWMLSDQSTHQVYFDAKTSSKSGGCIKAYFEQIPDDRHYISISASSSQDLLFIAWECHDIECKNLFNFIKLFFPSFKAVNILSGVLKGKIQTNFPASGRPFLTGEMQVENLDFIKDGCLTGKTAKANLTLAKNPDSDQQLTSLLQLDLLQPLSLSYFDKQNPIWKIDELIGHIHVDGNKTASLHLESQTCYQNKKCSYKLTGDINLDSKRELNVDLQTTCFSESGSDGQMRLLIRQLENTGEKKAEIKITNLSSVEAGLLQIILSSFIPSIRNFELVQGSFNGFLELLLTKDGLKNLKIEDFEASKVAFNANSIRSQGTFEQIKGRGIIHLDDPKPLDTLNLEFNFNDGSLNLEGLTQKLPLTNIQAHIVVQKGSLQHSLITLKWMGLSGAMDLEWGKEKELMTINLDGHIQDIAHLFPPKIQQAFDADFANSRLKILADFKRLNQHFDLSGTLHVQRHQTDQFDLIHFGCEFKKSQKEKGFGWNPKGWIYAYDLPLEKFVSPFIFRRGVLAMYGKGEFRGSFDQHNFTLLYNVHQLKIENDNLLIEAKDLRSDIPGQLIGYHQLDLATYSHKGTLPIKQANYFEKNSGLNFSNIHCNFLFENEILKVNSLETYCNGIFLGGNVLLDYSDPAPGVFNVEFDVPQISGTVSQIQFLLSHLKHPNFLNDIPLQGDINTRESGMQLTFDFVPHDYKLQANIKTSLADGSISLGETDLTLKGLYMDIDYHHHNRSLEISDIQGTLLVGKPSKAEEYIFGGNHIQLSGLGCQNINLDVWVQDHSKELARLKAATVEKESGLKEIALDSISHIGSIYPDSFSCRIKNQTELDAFNLESSFELSNLINELLKFKNTGLYCFSHTFLNKLSQLDSISGNIDLSIRYNPSFRDFQYFIRGRQLKQNFSEPHLCIIKGYKLEKKWIIEHLQWDEILAHAELQPEEGNLKIPFLGLNDNSSFLIGLEGYLSVEDNCMDTKVNLCEISLEHLKKWPSFSQMIACWEPKGRLKASGDLRIEFISQPPWLQIKADLLAELPKFTCKKCPISILNPFRLQFNSNDIISLEQLRFNMTEGNQPNQILIPKIQYLANREHIKCPQLLFQIHSSEMPSFTQSLSRLFPDLFNDELKQSLIELKTEGELKGFFSYEKDASLCSFRLKLDDGNYSFNNKNYDLKNPEFNLTNDSIFFSAFSHEEKCPYRVIGNASWPGLSSGEITWVDLLTNANLFRHPLRLKFTRDLDGGFSVQSMQGYFCGMNWNLNAAKPKHLKSDLIELQGDIQFDFNQTKSLFPAKTLNSIDNFELGSSVMLQGSFAYKRNAPELCFPDRFYFQGSICSSQVILKGFQFQELKADLLYRPMLLNISSLIISDEALKILADNIIIKQSEKNNSWWFHSSSVVVKNFRPYLLKKLVDLEQNISNKYKSFLIKRLDLQNLQGKLNDMQTWQAKGSFQFLNPTRKNISHPLLAIPAEIILRLGLNPQVLNPVTGTVFFDMKGDRFYFSRFKDVYSEGRGSKFYLADSPNPSWMDLQGNLNMQIRMKQYNLLFKLAELFTVYVEGNIKKPKFHLQKTKPVRKGQSTPFIQRIS